MLDLFKVRKVKEAIETLSEYCESNNSCSECLLGVPKDKQDKYGACYSRVKLPCEYKELLKEDEVDE